MIRLALVRHAKSDWSDDGIADHDRPLNARGERDAPAMARRLAVTGFAPDVIVSSTATRAGAGRSPGRRARRAVPS
ncbi:MAG: histidine phosphatase family protein [Microbacterium sp.]|nr:histidine phosphatase family protein [Microbacterium sp.]